MEADVLTDLATGKKYSLKPLGDVSAPWEGERGGTPGVGERGRRENKGAWGA